MQISPIGVYQKKLIVSQERLTRLQNKIKINAENRQAFLSIHKR